jgi:hypothetical protein
MTTGKYATWTGRGLRVEVAGVALTRGVPAEIPAGKLTALRAHPDVHVSEDPADVPAPEPPAPTQEDDQ